MIPAVALFLVVAVTGGVTQEVTEAKLKKEAGRVVYEIRPVMVTGWVKWGEAHRDITRRSHPLKDSSASH